VPKTVMAILLRKTPIIVNIYKNIKKMGGQKGA
jgi:uncharacterized membrane protein